MAWDMDLNNPIAGTHLDPRRLMYLRMQGADGMGGDMVQGEEGMGSDQPTSPTPAASTAPAVASAAAPVAASLGPVSANAASSVPAVGGAVDDDADWKRMEAALTSGMDDTPSANRVTSLEGQLAAETAQPSMKQRLLKLAIQAAPVIAGAIFGGSEGVAGATAGVNAADERSDQLGLDRQKVLRSQIESERGRQERQYERKLQLPITMGNMQMMRDYRRAQIGLGQVKAGISQQRADNASQKTRLESMVAGYDPDTGNPLPPERLAAVKQSQLGLDQANMSLKQAQEDLARARAAGIPEQLRIAEERVQQAGQASNIAMQVFMRDTYGLDMGGDPITGSPMDEQGHVLGWKAGGFVKPSGMEQSRGGQGEAIMEVGDNLIKTINDNRQNIGNVDAIIKSAFLGTPLADARASRIASELASYAALQPALHGFRGQDALNEFMKIIGGLPKDADALIEAIRGIRGTASVVAAHGKLRTYGGGDGGPVVPPQGASKLKKAPGNSGDSVENWGRDANGKIVRK